ncbi:hypothetical protein NLJ89_g6681 [Agrocybe chaxingu]|uniref:Uncharacterized protein n=1 Tax=Agrocybe chaxingu TaxID=84603 RepID=A0A9W8MVS5_9AGAR|nr:hypothetical protein NLJ89_g6681 [Agrocybe chaxingu]
MVSLRLRSPFIREMFPWYTPVLSKETLAGNFPQDDSLQPFLASLEQYENSKTTAYDPESIRLRSILLIDTNSGAQAAGNAFSGNVEPKFAVPLCSYLSGCRLVDLRYMVENGTLHDPEVRRYDRTEFMAEMENNKLALLLTSLLLFNPVQWFKKDYDRFTLIKTSMAIGNAKPTLLLKIERFGVEMLFSIARGMATNRAVSHFLKQIPWSQLDELNNEETHWFAPRQFHGRLESLAPPLGATSSKDTNNFSSQPDTSPNSSNHIGLVSDPASARPPPGNAEQMRPTTPPGQPDTEGGTMDIDEDRPGDPAAEPRDAADAVDSCSSRRSERLALLPTQTSFSQFPTSPLKRKRKGHCKDTDEMSVIRTDPVDVEMVELPEELIRSSFINQPTETSESRDMDIAKEMERPLEGSSAEYPVDVDQIMDEMEGRLPITLDHNSFPKKYKRKHTVEIYTARGVPEAVLPAFHDPQLLDRFELFLRGVQETFVNNLPLHMSGGGGSVFKIIQRAAYFSSSHKAVQEILRFQHIVIPGIESGELQFDENGLETLASLDDVLDVKDHSLSTNANSTNIMRRGTLGQILQCSLLSKGKILSASPHLMGLSNVHSHPFSSEVHAWRQTRGLPFCKANTPFPADQMHWTFIATSGAHSSWTMAPHGYSTCIDVMAGKVWYIVGRPKTTRPDTMAATNIFLNNFDMEAPNLHLWDLEAMLLEPRTRLVLRPNTPYTYFTLDHAIVSGTYFYVTTAMRSTVFGLIHGFMGIPLINVASHGHDHSPGLLIRRLANFYHQYMVKHHGQRISSNVSSHLFDLENPRTPFDVLIFCAVVILVNVLDRQTYRLPDPSLEKYDQNTMPLKDRVSSMYARGEAIAMVEWLFTKYTMVDRDSGKKVEHPLEEIFMPYLAQLHNALLSYKAATLGKTRDSSLGAFSRQLRNAFHAYAGPLEIALFRENEKQRTISSLVPENEGRYIFTRREDNQRVMHTDDDILTGGTTMLDSNFLGFLNLHDDIWFASVTDV